MIPVSTSLLLVLLALTLLDKASANINPFFATSLVDDESVLLVVGLDSLDTVESATLWMNDFAVANIFFEQCNYPSFCGNVTISRSKECRLYHYVFTSTDGTQTRFPSSGSLSTFENEPCPSIQAVSDQSSNITTIVSDILTAFSYFSISLELVYYITRLRRTAQVHNPVTYLGLALFTSFILLCGITHAFAAFLHIYPTFAVVVSLFLVSKIITAFVSFVTAVILVWLIPMAIALPIHAARLADEVGQRIQSEQSIAREFSALSKLREISQNVRRTLDKKVILATTTAEFCRVMGALQCAFLCSNDLAEQIVGSSSLPDTAASTTARRRSRSDSSGSKNHDETRKKTITPWTLVHSQPAINEPVVTGPSNDEDEFDPFVEIDEGRQGLLESFQLQNLSQQNQSLDSNTSSSSSRLVILEDSPTVQKVLKSEQTICLELAERTYLFGPVKPNTVCLAKRVRVPNKKEAYAILLVEGLRTEQEEVDEDLFSRIVDEVVTQVEIALSQADLIETEKIRQKQLSEHNNLLQKARQQVEDASFQTQLIAMMSHEIRTPMYAVIALTDLLRASSGLSEEQLTMIETLRRSGDHLVAITNDILDYTKYKYGQIQLDQRPFNLRRCVEDAIDVISLGKNVLQSKAIGKGQCHINYFISPSLPRRVSGDPTRLLQIFQNLLSNAVKFTEQGDITICLKDISSAPETSSSLEVEKGVAQFEVPSQNPPRPLEPGQLRLQVTVSDTGIGIPQYQLPFLFDRFMQADLSSTRRHGGTGLGLAICHILVQRMGGNISVASTVGEGATFTLDVILNCVDESQEISKQSRFLSRSTEDVNQIHDDEDDEEVHNISADLQSPIQVILVDAWSMNRKALKDMMQGTRFNVISFDSFFEASRVILSPALPTASKSSRVVLIDCLTVINEIQKQAITPQQEMMLQSLPQLEKYSTYGSNLVAMVMAALDALMTTMPVFWIENGKNEANNVLSSTTLLKLGLISEPVSRPFRRSSLSKKMAMASVMNTSSAGRCPLDPAISASTTTVISTPSTTTTTTSISPAEANQGSQSELCLHILIVDDNDINLMVTKKMLLTLKHKVDLASSGFDALAALKRLAESDQYYDVIFMDMSMPRMDGVEATYRIRQLDLRKPPWIIALTANSAPSDRQRCKDAGMNDFVAKPAKIDVIKAALQYYVQN